MAFTSPLIQMLMQQEDEDEQRRREKQRNAAEALRALQDSWRSAEEDSGPYAKYR